VSEDQELVLIASAALAGYGAAYLWRRRLGGLRFRLAMRLLG
jgi:hypothetical protein